MRIEDAGFGDWLKGIMLTVEVDGTKAFAGASWFSLRCQALVIYEADFSLQRYFRIAFERD